jgi:hypothetical protein
MTLTSEFWAETLGKIDTAENCVKTKSKIIIAKGRVAKTIFLFFFIF